MIIALQLFLLLLIAGSVVYYLWCAIATGLFFAVTKEEKGTPCQPVSILIPVCGVDEGAWENWESFCQQDCEHYEVVFGVMNPKDQAVPILEKLVAKFPHLARFIFCQEVRGINYQVSNLMHLLEAAQHEVVIFTDSDMRVKPDYLSRVTAPLMDLSIGVVTCGYVVHDPKYLVTALASLGQCIDFIPSVLVACNLEGGMQYAFGSTIATRKKVLEEIGGLKALVNRVASDYHIGRKVVAAGYQVKLSQYVLGTDGGRESFLSLFRRELRWSRSCRWLRGSVYYSLVFIHGTVYCIPLLLLSGGDHWAIIVCCVTITVRLIEALVAIYNIGCPKLVRWLWALPIRDVMSFVIFVTAAFGQKIYWRGRQLQIGVGGVLTE
ncbi:MAG: glycosyltransferase [Rhizonema sp. NSF051]|nr:glycosyltransferase [Rhizonema sp. NSF051]